MILETFQYDGKKWSIKQFPNLDSKQTLVLVFAAAKYLHEQSPILDLAKHYPKSNIVGCSSAGEIAGPYITDNCISVAVIQFEKSNIKITKTNIPSANDSLEAGKKLATKLNKKDLRGIFVLSDGLNINGSELVKGLNSIDRNDVVITGGLAGDGSQFKETWTIFNNKIEKNTIVAVGFYGEHVHIRHGSRGGWDIFGPERHITRSDGNILYELDGKPALALYKEYLGEKAKGLPATGLLFPLAIRKDATDDKQLVRTILGVDENLQSLTFAGDVPIGYLAQLMRSNFDRIIAGATEASSIILKENHTAKMNGSPCLLVAISCVGRRLLLGERTEEETESTLENFPENTQQVGFYSYGEISPFVSGNCDLHNQTMTLTSINEEF